MSHSDIDSVRRNYKYGGGEEMQQTDWKKLSTSWLNTII